MGGGAATLTPPGFGYLHGCPMDGGRKWGCLPRRHPCDRVCPTAPTFAHEIGWQEQDTPRAVPGGCRWVAGPPPLPLPALGISMGALWMGGKSRRTTLVSTLPIPRGPRSPSPVCLGRPGELPAMRVSHCPYTYIFLKETTTILARAQLHTRVSFHAVGAWEHMLCLKSVPMK